MGLCGLSGRSVDERGSGRGSFPPFLRVNRSNEKNENAFAVVEHMFAAGSLWSAHFPIATFFGVSKCIEAACN